MSSSGTPLIKLRSFRGGITGEYLGALGISTGTARPARCGDAAGEACRTRRGVRCPQCRAAAWKSWRRKDDHQRLPAAGASRNEFSGWADAYYFGMKDLCEVVRQMVGESDGYRQRFQEEQQPGGN